MLQMVAIIKQNSDLGNIDGLFLEIVDVGREHFKQSSVIRDVGCSGVSEERKTKRINSQMAFDAIRCFVEAKTFRVDAGGTGIFHRLRVNDDQRGPLRFFLPADALFDGVQP